ncbi:GHKL domain-containing protein [Pseudomonas sp. D2-30]|uniref:DAHL domain-containing protein n=1 Tax=unclassified Pseudomonas TaxID=196821 RepID=UPI003DAA4DC1
MTLPPIFRLVVLFFSITLLSVYLVFTHAASDRNQTALYIKSKDLVRQLRQQDANLSRAVMECQLNSEMDDHKISESSKELARLWHELDTIASNPVGALHHPWNGPREGYLKAVEAKLSIIEQLNMRSAELDRSLQFLNGAAYGIHAQFLRLPDEVKLQWQYASIDVADLMLDTLGFIRTATREQAAKVALDLSNVQANAERLPAPLRASIEELSRHVQLILKQTPQILELRQHADTPLVAESLNVISDYFDKEQLDVAAGHDFNHYVLMAFSGLLAFILVCLSIRLRKSFAQIRRMNDRLLSSNKELEAKVEERTRKLKITQSELVDTARQAGMAEIATNVLHNVGNVLNSVNISVGEVSRRVRSSRASGLGKAMQLINAHPNDLGHFLTEDEKGKLLPAYLNQLVEAIALEHKSVTEELSQLTKSVEHIKDVVATQQSYAGIAGLVETLVVSSLIEDALRMNFGALTRHHVTVVKEYCSLPPIVGDKHRLLLILINLISNAKYAMSDVPEDSREIVIKVEVPDPQTLCISVKDGGEGILAENMPKIFAHGFTTRKDGHGFGLHSCAIAAVEMGGTLTAHSEGLGKGAVFALQIPLTLAEGER